MNIRLANHGLVPTWYICMACVENNNNSSKYVLGPTGEIVRGANLPS